MDRTIEPMTTTVAEPAGDAAGRLRRRLPLLPWALTCGSAVAALTVLALVLTIRNGVDFSAALASFLVTDMLGAVSFGAVGLVIVAHRPRERFGWLLVVVAAGCAVTAAAAQYARYALQTAPGSLPGGRVAAWLAEWVWAVAYAAFLVGVPLLFPTGRLAGPRWRPVAAASMVGAAMLAVGAAFAPAGVNADLPGLSNPYAATGAWGTASEWVARAGTLLLLVALVAALASVRSRWHGTSGRERAQLHWMLLAATALVLGEALLSVTSLAVTGTIDPTVQAVAETALVPLVAVAIGVAVLRHRLYGIDVWLNRALVYGVLTVAVIGCYTGVVAYLASALDVHGRGPALLATGVVAVAFQPVRLRVQRAVNRLLYGRRDEPYVVLTTLSHRLGGAATSDVLAVIADTIREALRLPYAEVALDGDQRRGAAGTPAPISARIPLTFGHDTVGELRVAARQRGEPLTPADLRVLSDFAAHAGVAASAGRLAAELQQARQRLVAAREEERRRLARDLHDGLGPHLASYALTLDAARTLLASAPARADRLLLDLREQVQQAVSDVRRITRDLRPAAFDGRGLAAALTDHLERLHNTRPRIALDIAPGLPAMSAATEVAAFRIVTEAITNTIRHARAQHCLITVAADAAAAELRITVADDGRGIASARSEGLGLWSMKERAAELGGRCEITTGTRAPGVTVTASLPLTIAAQ